MMKINVVIVLLSVTIGACFILFLYFDGIPLLLAERKDNVKQPHIIVIMADDMGRNDVSYHGSNQIPTPNIDALAYNGVILRNHYVLPICTPSRTAILTGQYPIRTGMQGYPLSVAEPRAIPLNFTLSPEHFRNLGYATHLIGKWHVGYYAREYLPTLRGFDTFFGYYNGYIKYFEYIIEDWLSGYSGYDLHRDVDKNITVDWSPKNVYATDLFTDEAERIIDNHDADKPLYLFFAHVAPHTSGLRGLLEVEDEKKVNERFGYINDTLRRQYAGMLLSMDESVGRVVDSLNKKGILNDSIIVFMSDNGGQTVGFLPNTGSNYPYRGKKFSLFEGGVHAPAIVWSPLIQNKSRIHEDYFHITDWLPTLYHAAGGDIEDLGSLDGINQWDAIANGSPGARNSMLLNLDEIESSGGVIKGRFKYLEGATDPYGYYFGDNVNDGDSSAPPYNLTSVINSIAGLAIANVTNHTNVGMDEILELRRDIKIVCSRPDKPANCTVNCLFDIAADPCETTDVSSEYPEIAKELQDYLAEFLKVLVPQPSVSTDLRGFPSEEGGPWLPWLDVDGNLLPVQHFELNSTVTSPDTVTNSTA